MKTKTTNIVNVASVPQLSPFRYPGGKTWLVPLFRHWIRSMQSRPQRLIEPFAGGAIIGLTAAAEGLVDHVTLIELDDDVSAVWKIVLSSQAIDLADRIVSFQMSADNIHRVLEPGPKEDIQKAFATILRNRVMYGGIIAPGSAPLRRGENGRGVSSRWYPETLKKRILAIADMKDKIRFIHGDGLEYLEQSSDDRSAAYFIDPPYTVAGRRLYAHSLIDHPRLFRAAAELQGSFLMTYDNAGEIRDLAKAHGFDTENVPMKSTKHEAKLELLIGQGLDWARKETMCDAPA